LGNLPSAITSYILPFRITVQPKDDLYLAESCTVLIKKIVVFECKCSFLLNPP
jgi:hypothetical protein